MEKLKKFKGIIGAFVTICIIVVALFPISKVLERKDSNFSYRDFFENPDIYDVLFLGTSRCMDGFLPQDLWSNYGITAYNFGNQGCYLPIEYWVLKNALNYTSPEVIVVDTYGVVSDSKIGTVEYLHEALDCFPISKDKIEAVWDLLDSDGVDANGISYGERHFEYLWDFALYHNRWDAVGSRDFSFQGHSELGAISLIRVADEKEHDLCDVNEKMDINSVNKDYLCKIIELCKDNNIEIILTYLPTCNGQEEQIIANSVSDIADHYNIDYINFLSLNGIVDYDTDMADDAGHLNISGAEKVTDYIGSYLVENYGVTDRRNNSKYYNVIEPIAQRYIEYKKNMIRDYSELYQTLLLLHDNYYRYYIYIPSDSSIYSDKKAIKLLNNISKDNLIDGDTTMLKSKCDGQADIYIFAYDNLENLLTMKSYAYTDGSWKNVENKNY